MTSIRVLLVDDHKVVRAGIRTLIERLVGVRVVAEASNGAEAVEMVKTHGPHVVLMDIAMPEMNGLEALVRITREYPSTRVLMLSMHANEEYVLTALRGGASGYLVKDAAVVELELAIRAIAGGESFLSPSISRRVIDTYLGCAKNRDGHGDELTPRQREILQLVAEGRSTKEIAFKLSVSVKTVEAHRLQLMNRVGIHDVPGLVRYAMRRGVVPPETLPP